MSNDCKNADPEQRPQIATSGQGLYYLPLIQQNLNASSDSQIELFKF